MFGGIQGNTEKIFTVLMTCFHNPYIIRVFPDHGKREYLPDFMAVRVQSPLSEWLCEFLVHHHLVTCPAVSVHLWAPHPVCLLLGLGPHRLSCVALSLFTPKTHQAPVFCELSLLPDVVERGAEGEAGTSQHRGSCLPGPVLHPLLLAGQTPLVASMYPLCCPAGMFQPRWGPRDFRPGSGFLKHFLNKGRETAS